jgi:hypothetical protein
MPDMRKTLTLFAALMSSTPAFSEDQNVAHAAAANRLAIGIIAYESCRDIGYLVDPNSWRTVVEREVPGTKTKDFLPGGQYESLTNAAMTVVRLRLIAVGKETWCANEAANVKEKYPENLWRGLVSKSDDSNGPNAAAADRVAMGVTAYESCRDIGYKVDPNSWRTLVEREVPGTKIKDFLPGGQHESLTNVAAANIRLRVNALGKETWCANEAAAVKKKYSDLWRGLLSK